jgi:hypothetical protein
VGAVGRSVGAALLIVLAAGCGGSDSTNAGSSPAQTLQASTASESPTPDLDPIVGEWLRANTCEDLVQALASEGLQEFAAESVGGAALLTTPENVPAKDPKHPCADAAGPIEHSHKFWADGTFNSYNQFGEQVDDDEYEIVDENTIMFAGFEIDYEVGGDTIVFSFTVPNSCTSNGCRQRAAYAVNVFLPGETWERVS